MYLPGSYLVVECKKYIMAFFGSPKSSGVSQMAQRKKFLIHILCAFVLLPNLTILLSHKPFIYKYINSQLQRNIFDGFFTLTSNIQDNNTRHDSNLRPALHTTKVSSFCICVPRTKNMELNTTRYNEQVFHVLTFWLRPKCLISVI